ncbi:MAG: YmdB family metallophosphoesterase [Dehalococcoidia bacterium]|nr:YmdB family metallophosphoesterase [Dehalococcoidia bacterium]
MINGLLGVFSVRVLPKGTAFVTDVGMTGPVNSVIGSDVGAAVERFLTGMPKAWPLLMARQ